ncbi:acetylornithine deacetylase/succinyl-diaminopimelate desuccinylase-like protein [Sphingobium sp. OAS761]|uniref:M20/M25/M40 family metallo-hydrolase n=1 Tax=Sphingobium sp. OAS761 TaxID=2817901 RepID=UPI0020A1FF76|nr:M20/M25/M40 family metallo-hydrolase [Sphingobium sp. OAS761]MCP1469137.1 acetylornithine deacetylase/succinyl-diaminopimelate desuccinylase-like protein [Sphingobium sp. OAS761]
MSFRRPAAAAALSIALFATASVHAAAPDQQARSGEAEFRGLYKELVETDTSWPDGSCTLAAQRMGARLKAAGFADGDMAVIVDPAHPREGNLTAILRGTDAKLPPLLLLAHIDVVAAKRADWARDPFTLVEEGGYFYGRGTSDDKAMAAAFTDAMVRYRAEGYKPRRTIKLALTCGEETEKALNGVEYLLKNHPDALSAGWALNEGGGGSLDESGKPVAQGVQAGEKVYQDFTFTATAPGGHSSRQTPRVNAIGWMAAALSRINDYDFPVDLTPAARAYFGASAPLYPGKVSAAMAAIGAGKATDADYAAVSAENASWNATLRTTCIPTLISGGHAPNAQPQSVTANVNCRIIPGESVESVLARLAEIAADPKVKVTLADPPQPKSSAPELTPQIMGPIETLTREMWPGVPVIPRLATGATDGRFTNAAGIPTYGVSGMFADPDGQGVHGLNERIRVKSLMDGRAFLYRLVKAYTR